MTGPGEVEARLAALEGHVAHQDAAFEELSATVVEQWRKIDGLVAEVLRLRDRLQDVAAAPRPAVEPPPPHY